MDVDARRIALVALAPVSLAIIIAFITLGAPGLLANPLRKPPQEPIAFDHSVHVQVAKIDCLFCHRTAPTAGTAGLPDVQQCMFCHQVVSQSQVGAPGIGMSALQAQAEIDKLRTHWRMQQPIAWERVHRMPDHVRFLHEAHIRVGFACSTCHGDVGSMGQVTQMRALSMGDCISCHRQNNAPTECAVCHKRTKRPKKGPGVGGQRSGAGRHGSGAESTDIRNRPPDTLSGEP